MFNGTRTVDSETGQIISAQYIPSGGGRGGGGGIVAGNSYFGMSFPMVWGPKKYAREL